MLQLVALWLLTTPPHEIQLSADPLDSIGVLVLQGSQPVLAQSGFDPIATRAMEKHLATLQGRGYPRSLQGVWIQDQGGNLLASHQGSLPLPVASLTKIATTLGALSTWHGDSRFVTTIGTNGRLVGSTLEGDLIIEGGADPLFVWEDGIRIGNRLKALGINRIQGDLIVTPRFYMNFEPNRVRSANFFRQAIDSSQWSDEILTQYETLPPGTPRPNIPITGSVKLVSQVSFRPLIRYRSLPLWQILQQMNIYSNNVIADLLMENLGGARKVTEKLVSLTGIPNAEIRLVNGSGLGQENQISARGVVSLLMATQRQAQSQGLSLADLFPTGTCGCGTIQDRYFRKGDILKTGTLRDVSTLAGIIQTREKGIVWFALLNRGEGDISLFHKAQEELLSSLHRSWQEFLVWKPKLNLQNYSREDRN
jgi:D-alanyl-D-alanine carboxypeptidase/D-alanyl-D-alanine-endopeptidase (penicillin-binding protein 4)